MCSESAMGIYNRNRKKRAGLGAVSLTLALVSCSGPQSTLDPQATAAETLARLTWIMFWGASAIFLLVIVLVAYAVYRNPAQRPRVSSTGMIVAGGVALPVIVLSALLAYGVSLTGALRADTEEGTLTIHVTAHQYWWEVLYPGAESGEFVASANEIRIPARRPVALVLTSRDVIHSFWVPNLAGKIDLIPGRVTHLTLQADRPGTFRGQCAEFCGEGHARMALHVVALNEEGFEGWLAKLRAPARAPADAALSKGRAAFLAQGCGNCHAVRGVSEPLLAAPDLTNLASRAWLGAGTLRNTREQLIEWIVRGELVKPGRAMPSYPHLDAETLGSIVDYLGSLD